MLGELFKWLLTQPQKFDEQRMQISIFDQSLMKLINPRFLREVLKDRKVVTRLDSPF